MRTGDFISLDAEARSLNVDVEADVLVSRKNITATSFKPETRGYVHLYQSTVEQADQGCDLDFLKGGSGSKVTRESH